MKKNTIKGVKAWAILFDGQIETIKYGISFSHIYKSYKIAKSYGDSQTDYKVIPVLITPISKVAKNKENENNG